MKAVLIFASFALPLHAADFKLGTHNFTLPDGFTIEQVAGPPLIDRPIMGDFDEQGRFYVAESGGVNEDVKLQLEKKPHRILRLEDSDGDGVFDKRVVFADKMMFPEGVLCYRGSVYCAAPPSIWKLTDTDGDGVADKREEWLEAKTLTGCANDLHGPYLGPDGWIYWCKGAFAEQTYEREGKPPFKTRAAHIFRRRPEGGEIEPVITGGMDNPVEVVFDDTGEMFFSSTFVVNPGGGQRDGIIHGIYGGVYGKDHDPIYEHPRTGDLMPIMTHVGPAAISGLGRYQSKVFGEEFQGNLFATLFNMRKVTRHVLKPSGATFTTTDSDFLVSDNSDFHPTDVCEDADGSLLVIDTGGWYKLCCPTSQLSKPAVLGAIYRIKKTGAPKVEDPRGLKQDWAKMSVDEMITLLGDARQAVRWRAVDELSQKGDLAILALQEVLLKPGESSRREIDALWTLCRMDSRFARGAAQMRPMEKFDYDVEKVRFYSFGLWRDKAALAKVHLGTNTKHPTTLALARIVAQAVGRIASKWGPKGEAWSRDGRSGKQSYDMVAELLGALCSWDQYAPQRDNFGRNLEPVSPYDRVSEHALIYALIEIGDAEGIHNAFQTLQVGNIRWKAEAAALVALDQMRPCASKASYVGDKLHRERPVAEVAWWVAEQHPEWAAELAPVFAELLSAKDQADPELASHIAKFSNSPEVRAVIAETLAKPDSQPWAREVCWQVITQARLEKTPPDWISLLTKALGNEAQLRPALAAARRIKADEGAELAALRETLGALARNEKLSLDLRLEALAAVPGKLGQEAAALLPLVVDSLEAGKPIAVRGAAAEAVSKLDLSLEQRKSLAGALRKTGPLETAKVLIFFQGADDESLGREMLNALAENPSASSLRKEQLAEPLAKFPQSVRDQADALLAKFQQSAAQQKEELDKMLAGLPQGDITRGQAVYNSAKATCVTCHSMGYRGGKFGPDLTSIGSIRSERDLLEAIVYPSLSFVRSYEPVLVTTKSGNAHMGIVRKDSPEELVLAAGPEAEVKVAKKDVQEMQPGAVSLMPQGLHALMTPQELADLVAFLKNTKWR